MKSLQYFKALSDITRLRIVNLLRREELNVNEIVSLLDMGQSRVSRHLKILTDCGFLSSRRDGLWVFYRTAPGGEGRAFLDAVADYVYTNGYGDDLKRLQSLLTIRAEEKVQYFNTVAAEWYQLRQEILGDFDIDGRILDQCPTDGTAADLGCGTGDLLASLLTASTAVIGVDRSPGMLDLARKRFGSDPRVDLRIGELEHLPVREGEIGLAVISMVLHHLADPSAAILEAARVLAPGGTLVVADLLSHKNEEMRTRFGHRWLGFRPVDLAGWMKQAGLAAGEGKTYPVRQGMTVQIISARKKAGPGRKE